VEGNFTASKKSTNGRKPLYISKYGSYNQFGQRIGILILVGFWVLYGLSIDQILSDSLRRLLCFWNAFLFRCTFSLPMEADKKLRRLDQFDHGLFDFRFR